MPFQRIVFNFHVYCGDRSPVTGNPTNLLKCLQSEETSAAEQDITRLSMSSAYQSSGPAIFMSEFGATTSVAAGRVRRRMGRIGPARLGLLGLEVLRRPDRLVGRRPGAARRDVLADRDGAVADLSAGGGGRRQLDPLQPVHRRLRLTYTPSTAARGVTSIEVAASQHYPDGWCAAVKGGRITSTPGAAHLTIRTVGSPVQVYVTVTAGACP